MAGIGGIGGMDGGGGLGSIGSLRPSIGSIGGNAGGGLVPRQQASDADGADFSDTLRKIVLERPSEAKATADNLAMRFASGENVDPYKIAIASAKAGVEMQMATRTISQATTAVRTLFQMQI